MSDPTKPEGAPAPGEAPQGGADLNNIKAELSRKQANTDAKLAELQKTNEALLSRLQALAPAPTPAPEKKLSDLMYEDPEAYARAVEERAEERIMKKIEARGAAQQKQNNVIGQLVQEFPELSSESHALTKKALEMYNSLPEDERSSPLAYKVAVKDAALELGIKPKSKRTNDGEDDFTLSGGGNSPAPRKGKDDLDATTMAIARAMGRPVDDPKYIESLKKIAKRKSWTKYE